MLFRSEGAQWLGIEPFVGLDHFIQNMGDGTYFHSGQLAVQAAVAAGSNITFKILYNAAIGMTGGQDTATSNAPATGSRTSALSMSMPGVMAATAGSPGGPPIPRGSPGRSPALARSARPGRSRRWPPPPWPGR